MYWFSYFDKLIKGILQSHVIMYCRLFSILLFCHLLYPPKGQAKQLTFTVDDYCPYYCKDQQSNPNTFLNKPGYIIEILNSAFLQQGYQLNYLFVPWERGLVELNKNTMDGIIISSKDDAPELILISIRND